MAFLCLTGRSVRHTWVLMGPDSNKCSSQAIKAYISMLAEWSGGGTHFFFSGRGVRRGLPKCGACELTFAS